MKLHPTAVRLPAATLLAVTLLAASPQAQDLRPPIPLDVVTDRPQSLVPERHDMAWIPGAPGALVETLPDADEKSGPVVWRLDVQSRARTRLFDGPRMRHVLRAAGADVPEAGGPLPFRLTSPTTARIEAAGAIWDWTFDADSAERRLTLPAGASARALNGDDTAVASIVDDDLYVHSSDGTRRVTFDGRPQDIVYGGAAHRAEFGITDGLWWDPTGHRLAFSREDMRPTAEYPYVDFRTLPATAEHGRYPMAGQRHSKVTIGVYDRDTTRLVYLEHDPDADVYWTNVTFTPDGRQVWVALVDRAQSNLALTSFDASTGARIATILRESDPEWIEPEHGPIFLPDGSGFLWFSSQNGFRQLYRYTLDGTVLWQESEGAFDIKEFVRFGPRPDEAWVVASGADPRANHLFRMRLGKPAPPMMLSADFRPKLTNVTAYGPGWHECQIAEDGAVLDRYESVDRPPLTIAQLASGQRFTVHQSTNPLMAFRGGGQRLFEVETGDGARLYGHVLLPPNADALQKHPVLLYVYGGPHAQLVQDRWMGGASAWLQYMASNGYVVVRIDGRGTPNRGIDFEQMIHRGLGDIEVADQLAALDWVGKNVEYADLTRVGVHGWSFGGYMTLRLMTLAPEQFVCGVSGAPVTDWRRYETGYTERYMDTPQENPDGFESSSVLPLVDRIKGRMLLVQGTDDKTVMWSHAMAFLRRAIDAGVLVDFMAYPMAQHGLRGADRKHFTRLMTRFFAEHLPPPPSADSPAKANAVVEQALRGGASHGNSPR